MDKMAAFTIVGSLVALIAGVTTIIGFFEDNPPEEPQIQNTTIIIVSAGDDIPTVWRNNQVKNTFADTSGHYMIRYDRTLERVSPEDYAVLIGGIV